MKYVRLFYTDFECHSMRFVAIKKQRIFTVILDKFIEFARPARKYRHLIYCFIDCSANFFPICLNTHGYLYLHKDKFLLSLIVYPQTVRLSFIRITVIFIPSFIYKPLVVFSKCVFAYSIVIRKDQFVGRLPEGCYSRTVYAFDISDEVHNILAFYE